jgi:SAM-dependent methyltransferase
MIEPSNDAPDVATGKVDPPKPGPDSGPESGPESGDPRLFAPATERNRQPILDVLSRVLPANGLVLEVASGSGEHALWFAQALDPLVWQPSDPDPARRRSIAGHAADAGIATIQAPLDLDAGAVDWPIARADAVVCINMTHIAPWRATEGLVAGAARILPPEGVLYLYGPYRRGGRHTAPSNAAFDASLRASNPDWGLRDLEAMAELAEAHGLALSEVVDMPANNLSLVFTRT